MPTSFFVLIKTTMLKSLLLALCLLCFLTLPGTAAPTPTGAFQITGAVVSTAQYGPQDLRRQFKSAVQTITFTRRGVKHTADVVSLWAVLQTAGPRVNPQIKNHLLQFVVLVTGQDGYTAAFSMAELSPDFGNRNAWLAVAEDGKPLGGNGGGADAAQTDLLAPDDVKAGRWVHSVVRVTVVDEAQAAVSRN